MMDADQQIKLIVSSLAGKYMRYSDDFMIVLPVNESAAQAGIDSILKVIDSIPRLELEPRKTQIYRIGPHEVENVGSKFIRNSDASKRVIDFLEFTFDGEEIVLRSKTVSKYFYRMYRMANEVVKDPKHRGKKSLYLKYSNKGAVEIDHKKKQLSVKSPIVKPENFFTYVHRAKMLFDDDAVDRPVKNHMAKIRKALNKNWPQSTQIIDP